MDNMHEPPNGDPQDFWPTQEIGPSAGQAGPGGPGQVPGQPGHGRGRAAGQGRGQDPRLAGPGQGRGQPGQPGGPPMQPPAPPQPPQPGRPRRHRRAVWWGAGLALVALLAGGGLAAAGLSGSPAPAPGGPTGQAAALNSMLSSASSPTSAGSPATLSAASTAAPCRNRADKLKAAGHPLAAQAVLRLCRHPLLRLRLLGGEHGEFTFNSKTGPRTIAFERGVIESVSSSDIVVQAKDGTSWTWVLQSSTVIRQDGKRGSASSLSGGEHVFAGGPVASGGYDARLIVIAASSGTAPGSGSPASGS
jgi:hypothetical protein